MGLAAEQKLVNAWNRKHAIGTAVIVTMDDGSAVGTTTRSRAEVLSGHTAVIWLDGIPGCHWLKRVRAIGRVVALAEPSIAPAPTKPEEASGA